MSSTIQWRASVGGGIIGVGIASMHYLGMWALEVPGSMTWSYDLVLVSISLGILMGIVALAIAVRYTDKWGTFVAAIFLTLAITTHHFTAMGAVKITPDPVQVSNAWSLAPAALALAIAGVALSVLGMSLVAAIADRRHSARTNKFNEIIGQLSLTKLELERSQQQLTEQNLRLDAAISNMSQGLCMFDRDKRLVVCNSHYATMYGLSTEQVRPGATLRSILQYRVSAGHSPHDGEQYIRDRIAEVDRGKPYRAINKLRDGRFIAVVHQPISIGGWVALHQDITEQKNAEERIAHIAHHDALTGLANRSAVAQKIEEAAARQRRWGDPFSVLLLDLDRFKHVNDSLGHPAGDALLREVAARLKACLRETDVLARLGGDEFIIIQAVKANLCEAASALASRIIDIIAQPFNIGGDEVNISTSVGIALAPEHATDPESLIKMADMALYSAKSAGRGG